MNNSKPQINSYLWAIGSVAARFSSSEMLQDRYQVISPQIWQDQQPEQLPFVPEKLPQAIIPYLKLFPHRLHIPEVYGFCQIDETEIILLENSPIDSEGNLYPSLQDVWSQASALQQIYWLWQILELWTPLEKQGVAASLLIGENLRIEGWRVRLRELYTGLFDEYLPEDNFSETNSDEQEQSSEGTTATVPSGQATLKKLGASWANLVNSANSKVALQLSEIVTQLQEKSPSLKDITTALNQLLLEQSALQPLRIQVTGATDVGPTQDHNEDSYYPTEADLATNNNQSLKQLNSHLMIVCDGIGGHEGGEVASQLAVQSLKLQVQALLAELTEDPKIMTPELVAQQLSAIIRVANNLISSRNNEQGRESRRRMGTTLVMALQLPQQLENADLGTSNSHELYIAHVGDSRAYWLTPNSCQQLTVDDDVATREVKLARNLYREALQRPDGSSLTQALGTKDGESLYPTIQRFILQEDGLLLLCSDGLSDRNLLEYYWSDFTPDVISGKVSLEALVQSLITLANEKNGHDNTSIVVASYGVSPQYPVLVNLEQLSQSSLVAEESQESELMIKIPESPISEEESVSMTLKPEGEVKDKTQGLPRILTIFLGFVILIIFASGVGLGIQWLLKSKQPQLLPIEPKEEVPLPNNPSLDETN